MAKKQHKFLCLVLCLALVFSAVLVGTVSAFAAAGDTVYVRLNNGWSNVYCYMWSDSLGNNAAWPGVKMTLVKDNVYSYKLTKAFDKIIFDNGSGGNDNQTSDLTYPGKSGQISKVNLGHAGRYVIAAVFMVITFFTSIFPIISFAFETFLPNPGDYSFLYTGDTKNLTTKWWATSENITENGLYGQMGILHNKTIWTAFWGTLLVSVACMLTAGTIGTLVGYAVSKDRRSKWANYVNSVAFLPYLMPSIAVGVAYFILLSGEKLNLFNTYWILIIVGTVKYIPFASRSALNSMLQLSGEIEEAAIIQDIPWIKRMTRIIIPIQKSSIISGYLLPFMTCLRELSLFMLLCVQGFILSTTLDYFDEMGLYAFSSGINLILIITILVFNAIVNKVTGASLDEGIGG